MKEWDPQPTGMRGLEKQENSKKETRALAQDDRATLNTVHGYAAAELQYRHIPCNLVFC